VRRAFAAAVCAIAIGSSAATLWFPDLHGPIAVSETVQPAHAGVWLREAKR